MKNDFNQISLGRKDTDFPLHLSSFAFYFLSSLAKGLYCTASHSLLFPSMCIAEAWKCYLYLGLVARVSEIRPVVPPMLYVTVQHVLLIQSKFQVSLVKKHPFEKVAGEVWQSQNS